MSRKTEEFLEKSDKLQAVVIADDFGSDLLPLSDNLSLALFPIANKVLIDYVFEFLEQGGNIGEVLVFSKSRKFAEGIKKHIIAFKPVTTWGSSLQIRLIVSESCTSFGDCMRELYSKHLIRGNFVLCEPGAVANFKLSPVINMFLKTRAKDSNAIMMYICEETPNPGQRTQMCYDGRDNRILGCRIIKSDSDKRNVKMMKDNFIINENLRDTHISVCAPDVLSLYQDNFDFQTRDDFIKGVVDNEIMCSNLYWYKLRKNEHGGAVVNWKMYQNLSFDAFQHNFCPIIPARNYIYDNTKTLIGANCKLPSSYSINTSIIDKNCKVGENVTIKNSIIMQDVEIRDNCTVIDSIVGPSSILEENCKLLTDTVLGSDVILPKGTQVERVLIQSEQTEALDGNSKLGERAYKFTVEVEEEVEKCADADYFMDNTDGDEDDSSAAESPVQEGQYFFEEVMDSLKSGYEESKPCDSLILEINGSRSAYHISFNRLNFYVIKALLSLPSQLEEKSPFLATLQPILRYFTPILKSYLRDESVMIDCLEAIEEFGNAGDGISKYAINVLRWFYDKNYLSEGPILEWFATLESDTDIYRNAKPFIDWLQTAEEEDSDEDE